MTLIIFIIVALAIVTFSLSLTTRKKKNRILTGIVMLISVLTYPLTFTFVIWIEGDSWFRRNRFFNCFSSSYIVRWNDYNHRKVFSLKRNQLKVMNNISIQNKGFTSMSRAVDKCVFKLLFSGFLNTRWIGAYHRAVVVAAADASRAKDICWP